MGFYKRLLMKQNNFGFLPTTVKHKMYPKFIIYSRLFLVLCIVGFALQVSQLAIVYFKYTTVTKVLIDLPKTIIAPVFTFCPRYLDLFDLDLYKQETGSKLNIDLNNLVFVQHAQSLFTVKHIFDYTPSENDTLIDSCQIRRANSYNYESLDGNDCHERFYISKFFTQEYICYRYELKDRPILEIKKSAFALNHPSNLYVIYINRFINTTVIKIILNEEGLPLKSASFAPIITRPHNSFNLDHIRIKYYKVKQERLPAPYKTACIDYTKMGFTSRKNCTDTCIANLTIKQLNRVPFSMLITQQYNIKPINYFNLNNKSFADSFAAIEEFCHGKCKNFDCSDIYMVTGYHSEPLDNQNFKITIDVPREPYYTIKHTPTLGFNEFLVYILSCFGIWFGLSVLSFNPFDPVNLTKLTSCPGCKITEISRSRTQSNAGLASKAEVTRLKRDLNNLILKLKETIDI